MRDAAGAFDIAAPDSAHRDICCCHQLLLLQSLLADEPTAVAIFPLVDRRGTSVAFKVAGHYLHDHCEFRMEGRRNPGCVAAQTLSIDCLV
ncbi:MAG UNVERIFIED_CONTAM: hypothetical protein LVR18_27100 [Planctomycetaceae bacterium]